MNTNATESESYTSPKDDSTESRRLRGDPHPSSNETSRTGLDILWVLAAGPATVSEIREELHRYYAGAHFGKDRLYYGLENLERDGLIRDIGEGQKRKAKLTERGRRLLARRELWISDLLAREH